MQKCNTIGCMNVATEQENLCKEHAMTSKQLADLARTREQQAADMAYINSLKG